VSSVGVQNNKNTNNAIEITNIIKIHVNLPIKLIIEPIINEKTEETNPQVTKKMPTDFTP